MQNRRVKFGVILDIVQLANPIFVFFAIVLPIGALIYANNFGSIKTLNYVHIMTGGLWTGIDLFMGFVLGPVLGGIDPKARASVFKRLIPRMTFLMPVISAVTLTSGIQLTLRMGLPLNNPWIVASGVLAALLTLQGLGILLPNEIRMFKQLLSAAPDVEKISRLGMRNAMFGGLQGIFQLAIVYAMANLRF